MTAPAPSPTEPLVAVRVFLSSPGDPFPERVLPLGHRLRSSVLARATCDDPAVRLPVRHLRASAWAARALESKSLGCCTVKRLRARDRWHLFNWLPRKILFDATAAGLGTVMSHWRRRTPPLIDAATLVKISGNFLWQPLSRR